MRAVDADHPGRTRDDALLFGERLAQGGELNLVGGGLPGVRHSFPAVLRIAWLITHLVSRFHFLSQLGAPTSNHAGQVILDPRASRHRSAHPGSKYSIPSSRTVARRNAHHSYSFFVLRFASLPNTAGLSGG